MKFFIQTLVGLLVFSLSLYNYLQSLNELTRLRMLLPQAQENYLQLSIKYQEELTDFERSFNLKSAKTKLQEPAFQHLRRYDCPKQALIIEDQNPSLISP